MFSKTLKALILSAVLLTPSIFLTNIVVNASQVPAPFDTHFCDSDIVFIGARGSGQPDSYEDPTNMGMGPEVKQTFMTLDSYLSTNGYDASRISFKAIDDYYPAFGNEKMIGSETYNHSVNTGLLEAQGFIDDLHTCESIPLMILEGYSQGAETMKRVFNSLPSYQQENVLSLMLVSDPSFGISDGTYKIGNSTYTRNCEYLAIFPTDPLTGQTLLGEQPTFSEYCNDGEGVNGSVGIFDKTSSNSNTPLIYSYCLNWDLICDYPSTNFWDGFTIHSHEYKKAYVYEYLAAVLFNDIRPILDSGIKDTSVIAHDESSNPAVWGVAPPPVESEIDRVARLSDGGALYVKEGELNSEWKRLYSTNVKDYQLEDDRVAFLSDGGALYVKEGALNSLWRRLYSVGVVDFQLEGDRVARLQGDGNLYAKDGGLDSAWVHIASNVDDFQLEGDRIAVRQGDALKAKEGSLTASWVALANKYVKDFQLEGDRVAWQTGGLKLHVKEGALNAPWVTVANNYVHEFQLEGDRIAWRTGGLKLFVKDGAVTAPWVTVANNYVHDFQLEGDRIAWRTGGGKLLVKDGSLSAPWKTLYSTGVVDFELKDDRVGFISSSGALYVKEGSLSAAWVRLYSENVQDFELE